LKAAEYQPNNPARNEWVLVPARGKRYDLPCFHGDLHGDLAAGLAAGLSRENDK
jgi:hypothetical protein